jgi:hypothetical protein
VVRLAAILTLLAWTANTATTAPPPRGIARDALLAGFRLWESFRLHAHAVFQRGAAPEEDRRMRRVLGWIRDRGAACVSRDEVRRHALSQAVKGRESRQVIKHLEQRGFLRPLPREPDGRGRPAEQWEVNPAVHG